MIVKLTELPTRASKSIDKEATKIKTKQIIEEIQLLQDKLIASNNKSLLVILQGMDAAGKDGTIKNVFGGANPLNIKIHSFKKPTEEEMAHDFLWRIHKVVPKKGEIAIFNRSHYEDVLIQRVHNWVDEKIINFRYSAINQFETLLEKSGTKIVKCYLHISEEEQLERLQERKENPTKMWKHNDGDWEERKYWVEYRKAYESVFKNCSKPVKWNIVAADQNWYKEYQIAVLVKKALEEMKLEYPIIEIDEPEK